MRSAFIVSAVRVPTGKFLGTLKDFAAPELGAMVVREAVARAGIDPAIVDECIMGNVVSGGVGQAPARQAALKGGLEDHVGALTINKVCGSGLKAVMLAQQGIQTGDIDIAVAGGMESMSNCPYIIPKVREGLRMGNGSVIDLMIHDGLWCPFENWHMGNAGETVADVYKVTRDQQDQYSADSHKKAAAAQAVGQVQRRDPAGHDPAEEGRPARLQQGRIGARRHDRRRAARTQARVQERRLGNGRQRAARQRRRRGARRHGRRQDAGAQRQADRPHRRAGHERPRAEDAADDAGRSDAQGLEEGRLVDERRRSDSS